MRSVKEIGENSDRALVLATESTVIEKIKAQGPVAHLYRDMNSGGKNGCLKVSHIYPPYDGFPVYRLPEGDL